MKLVLSTILVAGALALAGCSSSDDDSSPPTTDAGGNPDGGNPGTDNPDGNGTTPVRMDSDVMSIAARGDTEDAAALDRASLQGQLDTMLGDADMAEPLAVEDDDTAAAVLQRGSDAGR